MKAATSLFLLYVGATSGDPAMLLWALAISAALFWPAPY